MASRRFSRGLYHFTPDLVRLHCKITFATTGGATLAEGTGITSVTKDTGTGLYTFLLDDYYGKLQGMDYVLVKATASDTYFQVTGNTISSDKKIGIDCFKLSSGSAVNPSSCYIYLNLWLDNRSTV